MNAAQPPGEAAGPVTPGSAEPGAPKRGAVLWHGRFEGGPDEALLAFTTSLPFDQRLAPDDIAGSRAHARGLHRIGLLSADELEAILSGLDAVEAELADGTFAFVATDEDVHTAVERRVTELTPVGAKLHTGRSRNDQVATDLRLYTKRSLRDVSQRILGLQEVLLERATDAGDAYLPGYTHLQRAQPVTLAHHLLAHGWALGRDIDEETRTVAELHRRGVVVKVVSHGGRHLYDAGR